MAFDETDTTDIKASFTPEYSKDDFIRNAWIDLALNDAPMEIFDMDFEEVSEHIHQVYVEEITVETSYQVSIGYDREEPYIDYEDYYEKEPYITTESYYDQNTRTTRERQVTKYKDVKKQRQVTKYKTVTDWSALNGKHNAQSLTFISNFEDDYLDTSLFKKSFANANLSSCLTVCDDETAKSMQVTESAREQTNNEHIRDIDRSVRNSLPGDHYQDLDWNIERVSDVTSALYKAPEYSTSITYEGKTYVKYAFPFGSMEVAGEKIKNDVDLKSITAKMKNESDCKNAARKKHIDKKNLKKVMPNSLLTFALLLASILISNFANNSILVIVVFIIATILFIANMLLVKSTASKEKKLAEQEIEQEIKRVDAEIKDYSNIYKDKLCKRLNEKLISLGYEPISEDFFKG